MEASTIPATAVLTPGRTSGSRVAAGPLLRLRSDEQLVRLFRAGSEEAFRVIHDRYRARLFAYARQMLAGSRADAEDALQDVFVRAYGALRANHRDVSLRAWLYRIAHNRCIDELRRPAGAVGAPAEVLELVQAPQSDPMDAVERRESLRRLVEDVQRLPEQQRSALLMREISGMAYQDLATALDVTVPAVKSLLVRARIGLAQASEARDAACSAIRADLADAYERGVRASGLARRHLHDCTACSAYRRELRSLDARLAALAPALGPTALIAKLLGLGGGGAGVASGGAGAAGGATAAGAAAGAGAAGIGVGHIAAVVAVAVVSAGGAVEVHQTLAPHHHRAGVHAAAPYVAPAQAPAPLAGGAALALAPQLGDAQPAPLRIVPSAAAVEPIATGTDPAPTPVAPTLDPPAAGPGNGGAAAPVEPPSDSLDPVAPPAQSDDGAPVGSSGAPAPAPQPSPTAGDDTAATSAPSTSSASSSTPPAASVASPAPNVSAAPPTSATTGGATFAPRHRRR